MESRSFPRSAMALIRRTDNGSVQFTISTPNRLLTSYEQDKPLLAIMNMANRNAIDRVMGAEIADKIGKSVDPPPDQKLNALKGLKVGAPGRAHSLIWSLPTMRKRGGLVRQ
jgi:hypothetical protein